MHYILAQLQKPQNRHYSALGPLYLKIKVSKMGLYLVKVTKLYEQFKPQKKVLAHPLDRCLLPEIGQLFSDPLGRHGCLRVIVQSAVSQ